MSFLPKEITRNNTETNLRPPTSDLPIERPAPEDFLTLSLPESVNGDIKVFLAFESVDEILWYDHSNETY